METIAKNLKGVAELAQRAGPYFLLEVLLPGGTLFALLLFLYRSRRIAARRGGQASATLVSQAIAGARRTLLLVQPHDIASIVNGDAANDPDGLGPLAMVPMR